MLGDILAGLSDETTAVETVPRKTTPAPNRNSIFWRQFMSDRWSTGPSFYCCIECVEYDRGRVPPDISVERGRTLWQLKV